MLPYRTIIVLLLAICLSAGADDQSNELVDVAFSVIRLPQSDAFTMVTQLKDPKQAAGAYDQLLDKVNAKKAKLMAWPMVSSLSGQRAVAEQSDEFRYATEYREAGRTELTRTRIPAGSDADTVNDNPLSPKHQDGKDQVKTTRSITEGIPTAFETRNLGVSMEVDLTIQPDGLIQLNLRLTHTSLIQMQEIKLEDKTTGRVTVVEQPEFQTHQVTTSIKVHSGDLTLMGVFQPKDEPGTTELFILHTQIR